MWGSDQFYIGEAARKFGARPHENWLRKGILDFA
jgi:hypothetical protein